MHGRPVIIKDRVTSSPEEEYSLGVAAEESTSSLNNPGFTIRHSYFEADPEIVMRETFTTIPLNNESVDQEVMPPLPSTPAAIIEEAAPEITLEVEPEQQPTPPLQELHVATDAPALNKKNRWVAFFACCHREKKNMSPNPVLSETNQPDPAKNRC